MTAKPQTAWCLQGCHVAAALLGAAMLLLAPGLRADPVTVINALRMQGCGDRPASGATVAANPVLANVARQWSRNAELPAAFELIRYPAAKAASLHMRGSGGDDEIRRALVAGYCDSISDPSYEEIGVFVRGEDTWIVLAVREAPQPLLQPAAVAKRVLELVNAIRAEARTCGRDRYAAAPPLKLSAKLNEVASGHSWDMAAHSSPGHRGSDGSLSAERITRAGYAWQASGENVAAGQPDADTVVAAWLESPGHCANLMASYFTEMGIAFALARSKDPAIYWTQVFATPLARGGDSPQGGQSP